MKLDGNTRALVTGAGSGLGRAIALQLAARRCRVVVTDRDVDRIEKVSQEVEAAGGQVLTSRLDVADPEDWGRVADFVRGRWDGLDVLVNNAGVASSGGIDEASLDAWRLQMDINVMGVVHGVRTFHEDMVRQRRGHIVNIASFAGIAQAPGMIAYNTAKGAVVAFSESLQVELAVHDVGVSVVCPAFFKTQLTETMTETSPEMIRRVEKWMEESGVTADDVASAAVEAVERNRFLVLTHRETRNYYWLKRIWPSQYRRLLRREFNRRMAKTEARAVSPEAAE